MFKKLILSLLLSLCGCAFALLAIEIVYRVFLNVPQRNWNDRPDSYYMPEGATSLNDRVFEEKKPPGTIRIAVVGDSFTFGPFMQFDDTFAKRLERLLNLNRAQPAVEVMNMGVPSYSTSNEVRLVKRAVQHDADLVLLQITLNDAEFKPIAPAGEITAEVDQLDLSGSVLRHWKSLGFLLQRLHNRRTRDEYQRYYFDLFEKKRNWEAFTAALKEIADLCRSAGKPVVAVVFPLFGHEVNDNYPFFAIHRKISEYLSSIDIRTLDLADAYRELPVERLQVIPGVDRHPNEIAHRIAAEAILKWLPTTGALPQNIFPRFVTAQRKGIRAEALKDQD